MNITPMMFIMMAIHPNRDIDSEKNKVHNTAVRNASVRAYAVPIKKFLNENMCISNIVPDI